MNETIKITYNPSRSRYQSLDLIVEEEIAKHTLMSEDGLFLDYTGPDTMTILFDYSQRIDAVDMLIECVFEQKIPMQYRWVLESLDVLSGLKYKGTYKLQDQ